MAILIEDDANGSAIVPMLEREGLRVEITRSPEQALERLQEIVEHPSSFTPGALGIGQGGSGSVVYEEPGRPTWEHSSGGVSAGTASELVGPLDRRLAAVQDRARALEREEQTIINDALQQATGNKTAAARLLGISRYALQRRLRRFAKPQPS